MKKGYYLFYLLAAILLVLLIIGILHPTDKYTTAMISEYLLCFGGATGVSLLYLGFYFSRQEKLMDVEAYRKQAWEEAQSAFQAEFDRLEAELRDARTSIDELKTITERYSR